MSRDWLLYLHDLIAAEKIGRLVAKCGLETWRADEAAFDAVLFNLQVVGEAIKIIWDAATQHVPKLLAEALRLRKETESGPSS